MKNIPAWALNYVSRKVFGDHRLLFNSDLFNNSKIKKILTSYLSGKPLSKIFQEKFFWNHCFYTNEYTLDPRAESELIIENIIKRYDKNSKLKILDLGTGTGAIVLSLLKEFPNWTAVAIDCCPEVLKVAKFNRDKLGLTNRCRFLQNNWLESHDDKYDLCISNPPYILAKETINPGATYDPPLALFCPTILYFYKKIAVKGYLFKNIILEVNPAYIDEYLTIFPKAELVYQLNGVVRCIFI